MHRKLFHLPSPGVDVLCKPGRQQAGGALACSNSAPLQYELQKFLVQNCAEVLSLLAASGDQKVSRLFVIFLPGR